MALILSTAVVAALSKMQHSVAKQHETLRSFQPQVLDNDALGRKFSAQLDQIRQAYLKLYDRRLQTHHRADVVLQQAIKDVKTFIATNEDITKNLEKLR